MFKAFPVDNCFGPENYFAYGGFKKKQRSTAGCSGVMIGVWDISSRSWQLYAQIRTNGIVTAVDRKF